jgi:hypothetical protein
MVARKAYYMSELLVYPIFSLRLPLFRASYRSKLRPALHVLFYLLSEGRAPQLPPQVRAVTDQREIGVSIFARQQVVFPP